MPANPAASARETGADESRTTQTNNPDAHAPAEHAHDHEDQQPLREPIGARLGAILEQMGQLPDDVEIEGQEPEPAAETAAPPQRQGKPPGPHAKSGRAGKGSQDATEQSQHEPEELTPEQRRNTDQKLLARIDKVTAQRTAERERREAVERENAELRAKLVAPAAAQPAPPATRANPQDPLADLQTPEQLRSYASQTEELHEWAMANLDGATDVNVGKDAHGNDIVRDISAAEARKIWADTDKILRKAIPQKAASFEQETRLATERQQFDARAKEEYPEVYTPGTEENQIALEVVKNFPGLEKRPDGALHLGAYVEGLMARRAREAAKNGNGNGNGNGKVAGKDALAAFARRQPARAPQLPRVERPSTSGSRAEATDTKIREAATDAAEAGDTEDLVGAILEHGRQQRSGHALAQT